MLPSEAATKPARSIPASAVSWLKHFNSIGFCRAPISPGSCALELQICPRRLLSNKQMNSNPPYERPDVIDLTGPDFDFISSEPARRTLLICAGPRTGSFELCRYLIAAGIGVPHEYFLSYFAKRLAKRWGIFSDPLAEPTIARYIEGLRRRRSQGGVFA